MLQVDSGGHDKAVTFSVADGGTAVSSHTASNLDYVIGATKSTGDNSTIATSTKAGIVITLESNDAGTDLNKVSGLVDGSVGASLTALTTDYTTNTAWAKAGLATGTTVEELILEQLKTLSLLQLQMLLLLFYLESLVRLIYI